MSSIDEMLGKLNEYQRRAVLDESPASLVNACVGSGKTTVLISKVFYLYAQKGVSLKDMVVLTFTNKASGEIRERIRLTDPSLSDADMPYFGTFHSVAMKLLQTVLPISGLGFTSGFTVMDQDELTDLASAIAAEKKLNIKYLSKLDKRLEAYRSGSKLYAGMKNPDDIDALWEAVAAEKKRMNKLDFDDLILCATDLSDPSLYSPKWIIVDEFQDCDAAQLAFLRKLSAPHTRIFAVGDPNQVIYSWRGSSRNLFRDFSRAYQCCEYTLPLNYRSSSTILEAAASILGGASELSGIREQGSKIRVRSHYNPFNEAEYLADRIRRLHENGIAYSEIAVLYRMQKQSRTLEDSFSRAQIPFEVSVRKTLKDVPVLQWFLRLLRAAVNPQDLGSLASAISNPAFGEGFTPKEARKIATGKSKKPSELRENVLAFSAWVPSARTANDLYDYFKLDGYLSPTSARFAENKRNVVNLLKKFQTYLDRKGIDVAEGLIEFLNSASLYGVDVLKEDVHISENSVKLMTLHACKGLEFRHVFLIGVNFGLIPVGSSDEEEKEEEKRLFFVGITRAKDSLELSYYTSPDDPRVSPGASSFLSMIPRHLVEDMDAEGGGTVDLQALRREISEQRRRLGLDAGEYDAAGFSAPAKPSANVFADPTLHNPESSLTHCSAAKQASYSDQNLSHDSTRKVRHAKYGIGVIEAEDEETVNVHFDIYGSKSFSKLFNPLEYL